MARRKGKNWVAQQGGLPRTVRRIANHLMKKGYSESRAIAIAVNAVKRGAKTGDLNFPGKQNMSAKSRARYSKAYASWVKKRAKARAS